VSDADDLLRAYKDFIVQPWERTLAGPQKVWFLVYEPRHERRIRLHLTEFELATREAGHDWTALDLTDAFGTWMGHHEYAEAYYASGDLSDLQPALRDFEEDLQARLRYTLETAAVGDKGVVAIYGLGSLFGITSVSALIEAVAGSIRGRLLAFFPGQHEGNNYRLLDARDGWNYLAVPITKKDLVL